MKNEKINIEEEIKNILSVENRAKQVFSELRDITLDSTDTDTGFICGYGNVKGCLDSHGTIMVDGCYRNSIPDFIINGFLCDTHGADTMYTPTLANIIGFFTNAIEDATGLYVEAVFDSSTRAQEARAKIAQRLNAGKNTGFSIGFQILDSFVIYAKDYDTELPKYLKPEYLEKGMQDALQFAAVEIVTELGLIETSATVIPSNKASLVTQVRSNTNFQIRKNMDNEIRAGKKLSAESHDKLSQHLDKLDAAHQELSQHLSDMADDHRTGMKLAKTLSKALADTRVKLDAMRDNKDDDKGKDEPDGDEKKDSRSEDIADIYTALEEINKKLNFKK